MKAKVLEAKNPKYANEEHTLINLEVNFSHLPEDFVEFTAGARDYEPHGRKLYEMAVRGDFGKIKDFE